MGSPWHRQQRDRAGARAKAPAWTAVVLLGLDTIAQMMFLPAYPFWSIMIIAVDVVALWGLCAYGGRENLAS
jgi:hypothetical protein